MKIEEIKKEIYEASKADTSSPKDCIHLLVLHRFLERIFKEFTDYTNRTCETCADRKNCATLECVIFNDYDFCCDKYQPNIFKSNPKGSKK